MSITTVENPDDNRPDDSRIVPRDNMDIATARAAQEVQAAMVVAKKFPRDENKAFTRIIAACKRKTLAEVAIYTFPRGGTTVQGPSIRLAEVLAQAWGNVDFGITELEQRNGESSVMAYCWDLETNTRNAKVFTVKHERLSGRGVNAKITVLTDPRDIYEMTANNGARRLRACILAIIPGDIVDAAVEECDKTMAAGAGDIPLIDRVRKMAVAFADFGVTTAMLEKRVGHKLDVTSEAEFAGLRKIFAAIRDGMGSRESYFDLGETTAQRPAPPEKAPQGVAAAMQQPSAKADVPSQAPGSASPETVEQTAPAAREEPAPESKKRGRPAAPKPETPAKPQEPEQRASRTELADKEVYDCIIVPRLVECLLIGTTPTVKLEVSGEYSGIIYHFGGATKGEGDKMIANAVWQVGRAVKAQLLGKLQSKSGQVIVFVQHAETAPMDPIEV